MTLDRITLLTVPVTDQDRARTFYVDVLGFTVAADYAMGRAEAGVAGEGTRWLMLTPPGGGADVVLSTWSTPPGSANAALRCDDVDATYDELLARGADPMAEPADAPWGRWFGVRDPDGNEWLVTQPPAAPRSVATVAGVAKIVVQVRDQARARDFWVGRLGFSVAVDLAYDETGERRWIEVETPDHAVRLVLDPSEDLPEHPAELPNNPFFFYTDDIEATYTALSAAGVEFPQPPERQPWGWWCLFVDSEGNRFALQER